MNRPRVKEFEEEDKEKRDNAEAAFREWLKRKAAEPRTPRASPSRYFFESSWISDYMIQKFRIDIFILKIIENEQRKVAKL